MKASSRLTLMRCMLLLLPLSLLGAGSADMQLRRTLNLDGQWQIAQGGMDKVPEKFEHTVPVPGLVDLAIPVFRDVGIKTGERSAFWCRRTFTLEGSVPAVATLKIGKAMFGASVILNGKPLGEHLPCFTPGFFSASEALKAGENEVVIRIGATRESLPNTMPTGFDEEKSRFIPGIFDSVELLLSGTPTIVNVQVAPDLTNQQARVRLWLTQVTAGEVMVEVREAKSGKVAGQATGRLVPGAEQTLDLVVPLTQCQLWSPESPFLYELTARTSGDSFTTRFGMREFRLDPVTGRAMLNGKPYYMRGSNFTLYRFFEDADRAALPWDEAWVRLLHQRVKDMHWNSLRYSIGFPPEAWYRIADEEGILIQDEFPIWKLPDTVKTPELAKEYEEWMRERWNHPCVVIWDGNNETWTDQTAPAIKQVRCLDMSNRPWDNSYQYPAEPGDVYEAHPYHFNEHNFILANLTAADQVPQGNVTRNDSKHAVIINEYGWLWLTRDGMPTTLTKEHYQRWLGKDSTVAKRRNAYARYLAADTEFWRAHRKVAGVLEFSSLSYSRPNGQTSDHWLDVKDLNWEPEFYHYVKDAFAPVGLMLDTWRESWMIGETVSFPVVVVNDLEKPWKGQIQFCLKQQDKVIAKQKLSAEVAGLGTNRVEFAALVLKVGGDYVAEATLLDTPDGPVSSVRHFTAYTPAQIGLAYGKPVKASSSENAQNCKSPDAVTDGRPDTGWMSQASDPQWIAVDLGATTRISRVELMWALASGGGYSIQVSDDGQNWTDAYKTNEGRGGHEKITFSPVSARWVRVCGTRRNTGWGYSLWELRVFEK